MVASPHAVEDRIEELVAACRNVLCREGSRSLQAAYLYGSSLGPRLRPDSDIDVAVLEDPDRRMSWSEQARLADLLERAIGRPVDLRMLRDGSISYQAHVLEQGRLLWARDPRAVELYSRETLASAADVRKRTDAEWPRVLRRLAHR